MWEIINCMESEFQDVGLCSWLVSISMRKILGMNLSINHFTMGDKPKHYFDEPEEKKLAVLGDISLRVGETYCLEHREWLHDNLLEFYLEYLRHIKHKEYKDVMEIVGPTVSQCIKMSDCSQVVKNMIEPLKLPEKKVVLIPVNNASQADAEGSHWSLMIMIPSNSHFYHIDTLDMNKDCATTLAIKLCSQMKFQEPKLEHYIGTRQDNAVDCGLYVLVNADKAIGHFSTNQTREGFKPAVKSDISHFRSKILRIIKAIADEQGQVLSQ